MFQNQHLNYSGKSILTVRVTAVKFSQIEVQTEDGRHGVIPEREWSWDRSIRTAPRSFVVGEILSAVWLPEKNRGEQLYFSLCERENPWEELEERYKKGAYVTREIVSIRSFGVFVQIEPGITAVIWNRDLPIFGNEIPADLLTIGDKLRGEIALLDVANRKIELSVNKFLEKIGMEDLDRRAEMVEELFGATGKKANAVLKATNKSFEISPQIIELYPQKTERILILDDESVFRKKIREALQYLEATVDEAKNQQQAEVLLSSHSYDFLIIDINLKDRRDGVEYGEEIIERFPHTRLIYCSAALDRRRHVVDLGTRRRLYLPFVSKANGHFSNNLKSVIDQFRAGKINASSEAFANFSNSSTSEQEHSLPLNQALLQLLQPLIDQESFSQAFVLEVFPGLRKTALVTHFPLEQDVYDKIDFDALYFSPVRNIIETGDSMYHREITDFEAMEGIFKNLFPRYAYRSCMGAPVIIPGQPLKYVLYILDATRDVLPIKQREQILRTADQIGIAIERSELREVMIQANDNQNRGHLLGSLIHELSNKLPGIQESFKTGLAQLESSKFGTALKHLEPLQKSLEDLNVLFYAYSRLAHHQIQDELNLNEVVQKAILQLRAYAKERVVELYTDYDQKLPLISGYATQVEQILVNLLLNAVQHIELQLKRFIELAQHMPALDEHFNGFVHLSTRLLPSSCQIRILDSGPGIAYDRQKSIFAWRTSFREEGQGMGLYIGQNLAHSMGGKLYLADTIRFIGSLFILEFPLPENYEYYE